MPEFKSYSFTNVNAIVDINEIKGWGDGDDVLTIEPETDQFTDMAGAKGDVARAQTNDNRCTVTMKLLQTSSSNKILMAQYNIDRETGVGVKPIYIEDKESGEKFIIHNAWIKAHPIITRGQAVNTMDWIFRGDFLTTLFV